MSSTDGKKTTPFWTTWKGVVVGGVVMGVSNALTRRILVPRIKAWLDGKGGAADRSSSPQTGSRTSQEGKDSKANEGHRREDGDAPLISNKPAQLIVTYPVNYPYPSYYAEVPPKGSRHFITFQLLKHKREGQVMTVNYDPKIYNVRIRIPDTWQGGAIRTWGVILVQDKFETEHVLTIPPGLVPGDTLLFPQTIWSPPKRLVSEITNKQLLHKLKARELSLEQLASLNEDGMSATHLAAGGNCPDILTELLDMKADINARNSKYGITPLGLAANHGILRTVRLLLERKADVNARAGESKDPEVSGRTPFLIAVSKGFEGTASLLLDHNADPRATDSKGFTALHLVSKFDMVRFAKILVEKYGLSVDAKERGQHMTPLISSALLDAALTAKYLISKGANIESRSVIGATPLLYAATNPFPNVTRVLLCAGANRHAETNAGVGLVEKVHASCIGLPGLTEADLQQLASDKAKRIQARKDEIKLIAPPRANDIFIQDVVSGRINVATPQDGSVGALFGAERERPLVRASRLGKVEYLRALLDAKCAIDEENSKGMTALSMACLCGTEDCVRFLVDQKADIEHSCHSSQTPLQLACWKNRQGVAMALLDAKADPTRLDSQQETVLFDSVNAGNVALGKRVLAACAAWGNDGAASVAKMCNQVAPKTGCTALLLALHIRGKPDDMQQFALAIIEAKADVNIPYTGGGSKDRQMLKGDTPLIRAARKDDPVLVKALLAARANPNTLNAYRKDALSYAQDRVKPLLLGLRLKREHSFQIDETRGWNALTPLIEAVNYICQELENKALAGPVASELKRVACAEYVGDLFRAGPDLWEGGLVVPRRVKLMLQEIVRVAREAKLEKAQKVGDKFREERFQARKAAREIALNAYKDVVQLAVQDKVLTKDELQLINVVRKRHGLSQADHNAVLQSLGVSHKDFAGFVKADATRGSDTSEVKDGNTCVVCKDARSNHVVFGCMHLCLCGECAPFYKSRDGMTCPKCRSPVTRVQKVYF